MASGADSEKVGLTGSFRSQMGYGTAALSASTKKLAPVTRKFIQKKLARTDTLMGIALKYGVSVQDLKKENKLWNVDHLFLRTELLIPLTSENSSLLEESDTLVVHDGISAPSVVPSPPSSSSSSSQDPRGLRNGAVSSSSSSMPPSNNNNHYNSSNGNNHHHNNKNHHQSATFTVHADVEPTPSSKNKNSKKSSASASGIRQQPQPSLPTTAAAAAATSSGRSDGSSGDIITAGHSAVSGGSSSAADDFFSKYDNNIARLRGDVERMEKNAASLDGLLDSNPLALPPQGLRRQSSAASGTGLSRRSSTTSNSSFTGAGATATSGISDRGDRRSRTAALLLDDADEEENGGAEGGKGQRGQHESPVLLIRSRSNNKQVKSAIQSLRQADDDLFQL